MLVLPLTLGTAIDTAVLAEREGETPWQRRDVCVRYFMSKFKQTSKHRLQSSKMDDIQFVRKTDTDIK